MRRPRTPHFSHAGTTSMTLGGSPASPHAALRASNAGVSRRYTQESMTVVNFTGIALFYLIEGKRHEPSDSDLRCSDCLRPRVCNVLCHTDCSDSDGECRSRYEGLLLSWSPLSVLLPWALLSWSRLASWPLELLVGVTAPSRNCPELLQQFGTAILANRKP